MHKEKPQNIHEYRTWLQEQHGIEVSRWLQIYYESVANKIQKDLLQSDFWVDLKEKSGQYEGEYMERTGYPLFMPGLSSNWQMKPFESFLLKTFRKNVLDNDLWPKEPHGGWVLPNNWFCRISDIVRTLFVVKYMDGVQFLADRMASVWEMHGARCSVFLEARQEGYYAAHLYGRQEFVVPKVSLGTEQINVTAEIQITTQLQEVIRRLLHRYYEERRKAPAKQVKWQWDHSSDEFVANYLGHILHYVEGMIMEVREKQEGR